MSTKQLTFHEACELTFMYCPDGYAQAYAKAGMTMVGQDYVKAQSLYILNNMGHWHTDLAKLCRATFKRCAEDGEQLKDQMLTPKS
jgi:hypothetical protein